MDCEWLPSVGMKGALGKINLASVPVACRARYVTYPDRDIGGCENLV